MVLERWAQGCVVLCLAHCWVLRQQDRGGVAAALVVVVPCRVCLFLVFPAVTFRAPVWVCGVCGVGLLFENYIVDASILYKKQFPRLMNLDLAALLMPFGCWGVVGFCGSLEKCF